VAGRGFASKSCSKGAIGSPLGASVWRPLTGLDEGIGGRGASRRGNKPGSNSLSAVVIPFIASTLDKKKTCGAVGKSIEEG